MKAEHRYSFPKLSISITANLCLRGSRRWGIKMEEKQRNLWLDVPEDEKGGAGRTVTLVEFSNTQFLKL